MPLFQTSLIQYQIKYTNPRAPDFYLDPHQIYSNRFLILNWNKAGYLDIYYRTSSKTQFKKNLISETKYMKYQTKGSREDADCFIKSTITNLAVNFVQKTWRKTHC